MKSRGRSTTQYEADLRDHHFRAQRGRCFYCDVKCVIWKQPTGTPPDNAATLEHLFDKSHPLRESQRPMQRHVMACRKCNNQHVGQRHAERLGNP